MIARGFDGQSWAAIVIGVAIVGATIRLLLWQRSAEAKAPRWRLASLIALQTATGALLYLALFPPSIATRTGTLVVATGNVRGAIAREPGDPLVALPEAGAVAGATRVPDLAAALRRFPAAAGVRVAGDGLVARDRAPLPVPLAFDPPPPPRGLIELALPGAVAPGAAFSVGGRLGTLASASVELIDPAGRIVDRARVAAGGRFVVGASTRAPGLALFGLRLRDRAGAVVEAVAVPVETRAQAPPRVLVLAGAPGPETKYLRRWAQDAGIALSVAIEVGGGVRLGDAPVPLTRAELGDIDLVVIDDRRWETLDAGARGALVAALDGGIGMLLRPTGPLSAATRRSWAALGVAVTGGEDSAPVALAPKVSDTEPWPDLARRDLRHEAPRAVSMLRDGDGVALASWRTRGRGRIGIWTVADSYALLLAGRPERYGEWWSELFSALARAGDDSRVRTEGIARAGERFALCGVAGEARVVAPDGGERGLRGDPASGEPACAAYWPDRDGWHLVRDGKGRETPFYVHPGDAAPSLARFANRAATLALAAETVPPGAAAPSPPRVPGSPWPWFTALIAVCALLWWLERRRGGAAGGGFR